MMDPFAEKIIKLQPYWPIKALDEKKLRLFKLAKSGAPKPKPGTKLGNAIRYFTRPGCSSFDLVFNKKIRVLRPDWFQAV